MTTAKLIEHDDVTVIEDGDYTWQESDESRAFEDFRAKFKDEEIGTLRVHRVPVTNKTTSAHKIRTVFLFSCPIDAFSFEDLLEHIRDNYGGGTYRLIGTRAGHRGPAFNRLIEIEEPRKQFHIPGSEQNVGREGNDPALLVNNLGAVLLEHATRIEQLVHGAAQPMGDPMDQLTKMATAFGTIFGAMGIKPEKPKSLIDQLTEFAAVKDLFDSGSSGGAEANIYSLLTETVKNFGPLLGTAIQAQTAAGVIPEHGPIKALPEPDLPKKERTPMDAQLETFRPQVKFLLDQAKLGAQPADVAAALLPGVPEAALESLEAFCLRPDAVDVCIQVEPEVEQYREWFDAWRIEVTRLIDEMFESEPKVPSQQGDVDADSDESDLTPDDEGAQTSQHVAGLATEPAISADEGATDHDSAANGTTVGNGGDAGDSGPNAPDGAPVQEKPTDKEPSVSDSRPGS